jgi:hypothetical protein
MMHKATKLFKALKEGLVDFRGAHDIYTPNALIDEILSKINPNGDILVMFNIEFVISLVYTYNIDPMTITFYSDHQNKSEIARRLGVKYVTSLENVIMKSRPILLVNPPYTNGEQDASEIYTSIIDHCIEKFNPIAIGAVTPENMVNGGQKKKTLREKILKKYGLKYLSFLNQKEDWDNNISVDTIFWVAEDSYTGPTMVTGRWKNQTYTINSKLDEYINGETQNIHDWLLKIQTTDKVKFLTSKKTGKTGTQIKISKDFIDSVKIEVGMEFNSHNSEWRVAFGYMRCNTCAVVPPGVSIPNKYRYLNFGASEDNARKFSSYMMSEPVRAIMKLIYTSRTLDNPQLAYVPKLDMSLFPVVDNATLYQFWKINIVTRKEISAIVGNEVPF